MGKRKKIIFVVGILLAVTAVATGAYLFFQNKDKKAATTVDTVKVQTDKEVEQVRTSVTNFNQVLSASNAKDYEKTIKLAKDYGTGSANDAVSKLNAYGLCMDAAVALKQDKQKTECYEAAKAVANTLPDNEKTLWLGSLEDAMNGTDKYKGIDYGLPS